MPKKDKRNKGLSRKERKKVDASAIYVAARVPKGAQGQYSTIPAIRKKQINLARAAKGMKPIKF